MICHPIFTTYILCTWKANNLFFHSRFASFYHHNISNHTNRMRVSVTNVYLAQSVLHLINTHIYSSISEILTTRISVKLKTSIIGNLDWKLGLLEHTRNLSVGICVWGFRDRTEVSVKRHILRKSSSIRRYIWRFLEDMSSMSLCENVYYGCSEKYDKCIALDGKSLRHPDISNK